MYRSNAFAVDDLALIYDVIRRRVFATLAVARGGTVEFAHAPVVLDAENGRLGGVRFHLAAKNPVAEMEERTRVYLSMAAADAYVSPDWYRTVVTVPTWNYIAVEGEGVVRRLSRGELRALLMDLSAQEEERLRPKEPWTLAKLPESRVEALLNAIVGFSLSFERLEGRFKLSQDKKSEDFAGVIAGMEARGDPASLAIACAMKALNK
jgi:transcriptional regulator